MVLSPHDSVRTIEIEQQQKQIESLKQIVCLAHPDAEVCKAGGK